ncbi:ubiquinone biosynthesis protein COQ4 homolog, mitochondrial isoform X2 [Nilaparvata lugens]|nr:ubiquinone biosynthesis protein COQ4 homolog, mitochondrial isoform X2 [Nilaparvata lugens]XP_022197892.1 ubiquinone biosynthesis protein COQ4 homolog, mitochondrial isoform X2 [Nilaparvata lugens]XP_039283415.1 ubiquinone biosynthesis protein COQ4 homolog, mitochondrial isoform X2 [Nilaparvata lugens]
MLKHCMTYSLLPKILTVEYKQCDKTVNRMINTFHADYESNHIKLSPFQRIMLSIGSSLTSIYDPSRGDMIAIFGETTGDAALNYMMNKMSTSPEGQEILKEKPRLNSKSVDFAVLESLPENTLGKVYYDFLKKNKVTPDSRLPVQFIDDIELAYVMQRYREIHDLTHAVLKQPTNMLGEVTVKWVEGLQTRLPMCITGGLFGAVRLRPKQRLMYVQRNLPWAIKTGLTSEFLMNAYFEKRWEQTLDDFYREFKITELQ